MATKLLFYQFFKNDGLFILEKSFVRRIDKIDGFFVASSV